QPSSCAKGCNGGTHDGLDCTVDGDCPGGSGAHPCQPLCRHDASLDPGAGNVNEGRCVLGPSPGTCAAAAQVSCTADTDCVGGVGPCQNALARCFMDPIVRTGVVSTTSPVLASTFQIPGTSS